MTEPAERLAVVVELAREISRQTDPHRMIAIYRKRVASLYSGDSSMSLSRRELESPFYRITRSTRWKEDVNPWTQKEALPLLKGGLLAELLYGDEPRVLRGICLVPHEPAYEYLKDARALVALPLYDGGVALNMVVRMSADPHGFDDIELPDQVLQANLFGRATSSLLLSQQLRRAYAEIDHEMKRVAAIQRALLPQRLPTIPALDLAVSYVTAARAGGDYYDFFDLGGERWGILIADVSGHGTPAAVVMAMLRALLHGRDLSEASPGEVLHEANRNLCEDLDRLDGTFVTAFYGIYHADSGLFQYACAGHNPPLLVDCNVQVRELDQAQAPPLAILPEGSFPEATVELHSGDTLLLYTDGITEAVNEAGEAYGRQRLLSCVREDVPNAQHIIDCVVHKLLGFTVGAPEDDQTLLALRVR